MATSRCSKPSRTQAWRAFCAVYRTLNRQAELERLIAWARRQKLPGPRKLYENRRDDTRQALLRYNMASPRLVRRARLIHRVFQLINPPPKYPRQGMASGYRTNQT